MSHKLKTILIGIYRDACLASVCRKNQFSRHSRQALIILVALSPAACTDRKPKAPPSLGPEPSLQSEPIKADASTQSPALPDPTSSQDHLPEPTIPERASEGTPAKSPSPRPAPAPPPATTPTPSVELKVNQWDGKTDQGGTLWILETIP